MFCLRSSLLGLKAKGRVNFRQISLDHENRKLGVADEISKLAKFGEDGERRLGLIKISLRERSFVFKQWQYFIPL